MRCGFAVRFPLLVSLLSLFLATPLAAQFTGTWSGHYDEWDTQENCFFARGELTLAITQTGNSVAGDATFVYTHGDCDPLPEPITVIYRFSGTVAGNALNGTLFYIEEDGFPASNSFSFTLSGNTLSLNVPPPSVGVLTRTSSTPPDGAATGTYNGTYSASVRPSKCTFQNPISYSGTLSGTVWQTGSHLAAALTAGTARLIDANCAIIPNPNQNPTASLTVNFEDVTMGNQTAPTPRSVAGTITWNELTVSFTGTLNGTTLSGSGSDDRNSFTFSITKAAVPNAPSIVSFSATPSSIVTGGSSILSWVVSDATAVSIDNGVGVKPLAGPATVNPSATTTYTLTATGAAGPPATKTTTVTVTPQCPTPTLVITAFPRGMLQPIGGPLPTDSFTLTNTGATAATITLGQSGSFFTQSPAAFTLEPNSSKVVVLAATAQPAGFYPGTSTISACGASTGLSVRVVLRVAAPPAAAITVTAPGGERFDLSVPAGQTPGGSISFSNPGASTLDGVVVTDVPWIDLGNPSLSLAAGATSAVEFSVDRTKRPDAGTLAGGASGTISFRYINGGSGSTSLPGDITAQTTAPGASISVTTVVIVDVVKGVLTNQPVPPLGSQLALFVTGATSRSAFGDLVLSNRNPSASIGDLQMFFGANPGPPAQFSSIGQFPANAAFSFPGVVKNIFSESSRTGTLQFRSAQLGNVSVVQTQIASAIGKTYGTNLPVFRSDQGFRPGEMLFLPGVQKAGTLTTTLYLQEVAGAHATVMIDSIDEQGATKTSTPADLNGFGSQELVDFAATGTATLRVRNVSDPSTGGTINAYALVIDSATGDSFAVVQLSPPTGWDPLFAPAFPGEGGRFMALHLMNAAPTAINISATAVTAPAPPSRRRATSISAIGSTSASQTIVALPAIGPLGYQQLAVPEIGFVKLAGSTSLRAAGRYTVPRAGGTIGTGVPVVPSGAALTLNGKTRFAGIEDASPSTVAAKRPLTYQTNLMLIETTGAGSVKVKLTLSFVFSAGKIAGGSAVSEEFTVPSGGFTMVNSLGRSIIGSQRASFGDLHNAVLDVEVIGGSGAVIPFLQAIDNGTGDVTIRHQ